MARKIIAQSSRIIALIIVVAMLAALQSISTIEDKILSHRINIIKIGLSKNKNRLLSKKKRSITIQGSAHSISNKLIQAILRITASLRPLKMKM